MKCQLSIRSLDFRTRCSLTRALSTLLLWQTLCAGASAVEPWADKNLKISDGLVVWLDASVENAAREALDQPKQRHNKPLATWHDGSGRGRHVAQADSKAQPTFRLQETLSEPLSLVRFNGDNTFLALDKLDASFADLTVVIVAAPFVNDGGFRGLLAMNAAGTNDYVTGITIDQGPDPGQKFSSLNVEGVGFGGARNLKTDASPFGYLYRMAVGSSVGRDGIWLEVNGQPGGHRERTPSTIKMDRLTVGARFYNNGGPADTRGFFAGDIAEILIYDRQLSPDERKEVDRYLSVKYGNDTVVPLPPELTLARPVPRVVDPPKVQMLAPGFAARRLPLELTNINNLRYRPDGKLLASAYDGKIYLLSDTDGDGLEDHVAVFWDQPGIASPIGIALTPPGYSRGQGVFVACKGQLALVIDTDGDDRADKLEVVAGGWKVFDHGVDALGVAVAPDGSVYFGLGTENFTNGYLLDAEGRAHYAPRHGRGAVFRVSPDFKSREQFCSGVRFSVSMAFNQRGDLFCTDQEGATWLANGNPFDELVHLQADRHYGFPPRHPRHLNDVIDEPSVYDYSPQHQSTCGLCFNEAAHGHKTVGPSWWAGDALVCGYSRGKLFRTSLVKTPAGYVADSAVLGALDMLLVDSCLSPTGDLVLAAHGGGPDWGSGPGGKGALYKISYVDRDRPQPVRAHANSAHEVEIEFDRPLDPRSLQDLARQIVIECGPNVRAGDRFETLWPGYAVVELQTRSPRELLPVLSSELTADSRSIVLRTGQHAQAVHYALIIPTPERPGAPPQPAGAIPQIPATELTYNLGGVEAIWTPATGDGAWSAWWPHLDPQISAGLLAGSAQIERIGALTSRPGTLKLKTQLDLHQMLRPAVQPTSKLDYEPTPEQVIVTLEGAAPFTVTLAQGTLQSTALPSGRHRVSWTVTPQENAWQPIEVTLTTSEQSLKHAPTTGEAPSLLQATWHTAEDARERAFPVRRFMLPWARPATAPPLPERVLPPELAGGDWQRGRDVFYGEQAQCSKCHGVRGKGGWIGPDLTNLVHRDYASVLRDITNPSFAISPDHLAYNVVLDDGRTLTGMVQVRGDSLLVGDVKGVETTVPRSSVEQMTPTLLSIMPEGLPKLIGPEGMRDLLTFLLTSQPGVLEPAPIQLEGAPSPRTRAEVGAVLGESKQPTDGKLKPLELVLCAGPKDHDVNEHDYPQWQDRWSKLFRQAPEVRVTTADPWPTAEQWKSADAILFFSANPAWTPERAKEMDVFLARGGGLVFLHFAVNGQRAPEELARRIGLAWGGGARFRHGELNLQFPQPAHAITAGFGNTRFVDESYWNLVGDPTKITVLATQIEEGQRRPMLWTYEPPGGGRVFCSLLGHYTWTFDDPLFRALLLRGVAWITKQPIDRFNDLIAPGARIGAADSK